MNMSLVQVSLFIIQIDIIISQFASCNNDCSGNECDGSQDCSFVCVDCTGITITGPSNYGLTVHCTGNSSSCSGTSIIGQAGSDVTVYCDPEISGTDSLCENMNIDASLSALLTVNAASNSAAAGSTLPANTNILRNSNIICPDTGCIITISYADITALQCATIQAPFDIITFGDSLDCNDPLVASPCFDQSGSCGTTVEYIDTSTGDSCFIINETSAWGSFICLTSNPVTTTAINPNVTYTCAAGPEWKGTFVVIVKVEASKICSELTNNERTALIEIVLDKVINLPIPEKYCVDWVIISIECGSYIVTFTLTSTDKHLLAEAIENINFAAHSQPTLIADFQGETVEVTVVAFETVDDPFTSSDSDSASDSSDEMEVQAAYIDEINNMEQSEQDNRVVVNNISIEINVWNAFVFLVFVQMCITGCWGCWYAKKKQ